jgi:Flp pilus assembly protein TadD
VGETAPGVTQRFDLGIHFFLRREYREAARYFQEAVRESPADGVAWSYLGIALSHLGRAAEAEAALARAIALSPQNAEAWFHLGVARSLREEWAEAASAYRHAVALSPDDMVAWHRLGVALAESGEEVAASAAFERALVLSREVGEPGVAPPLSTRIHDDHLGETGEREGAREAKSWIDLALSLLSLGDEEEAVAAYERAYTLDPDRAQHSLFRPMLRLLTAVQGAPEPDEAPGPRSPAPTLPDRPRPRDRRPEIG